MDGTQNTKYKIHSKSIVEGNKKQLDKLHQRKVKKIQLQELQKTEGKQKKLLLDQTDTTSIKQKGIKKRNKICENKKIRKPWSTQEDQQLQLALQLHGPNWIDIAASLANRNPSQCAQRWKRIKPQDQKKRKTFSVEEDQLILQLVAKYRRNWGKIARFLPEKTSKQIRERYINKLNPQNKFEPFTEEEDQIILNAYREMGSKWTKIQDLLIGRPENMIKNRFYSYLRQKFLNIKNPYYSIPQKTDIQSQNEQSKDNQELEITEEKEKKVKEPQFESKVMENSNQRNMNSQEIQSQSHFQTNQYFSIQCPMIFGNFSYPQYQLYQAPVTLVYSPIQQKHYQQQNCSNPQFYQQIFMDQNVTNQLVFTSNS